jgi:hypothetical protein
MDRLNWVMAAIIAGLTACLVRIGWRGVNAARDTLKEIGKQTEIALLNAQAIINANDLGSRSPLNIGCMQRIPEMSRHATLEERQPNLSAVIAYSRFILLSLRLQPSSMSHS